MCVCVGGGGFDSSQFAVPPLHPPSPHHTPAHRHTRPPHCPPPPAPPASYADVVVHRLLGSLLGLAPLPEAVRDREALRACADNMNARHRNAQMAGRASVELHTLIFFRGREVTADARVTKARSRAEGGVGSAGRGAPAAADTRSGARARIRSARLPPRRNHPQPPRGNAPPQVRANGLIVFVPRYGIEGAVYLTPKEEGGGGGGGGKGGGQQQAGGQQQQFVLDEERQARAPSPARGRRAAPPLAPRPRPPRPRACPAARADTSPRHSPAPRGRRR